jgi:phage terminase large subunit
MKRNLCVTIRMEEKYLRMVIEYENDETRDKINEAISKIEKQMDLFPSVIRRAFSKHTGNFSVEFEVESEIDHRDAGEFCEEVMKILGVTHCEE